MYIPNGGEGNVTVVHQDGPDKYTVVSTVPTFAGAKTITVDPKTHTAYLLPGLIALVSRHDDVHVETLGTKFFDDPSPTGRSVAY